MADRIVVMNKGVVEQIGTPLELYDRPANQFVAGFIGSPAMNLLRGGIANGAFVSDRGLSLPIEAPGKPDHGRQVAYGIRPEHFHLSEHGVPVRVSLVEPTGSETQVMVEAESGEALNCVFRDRIDAEPGSTIRIAPIPRLVHLFDSDTGARIS